jgi:hypothetical protein
MGITLTEVQRQDIANLVIKYGQQQYHAGVASAPSFTIEEHSERLDSTRDTYVELLRLLYPDCTRASD